MESVYDAAGGTDGIRRLAAAWHERVMADEVVSHAFSHGFRPDHVKRLAAYWAEVLGGPALYSSFYGSESAVVALHSGMGAHEEMDSRAIACFDGALADVGLDRAARLRDTLHDYFTWATKVEMGAYPASTGDVPAGLSLPRWSWSGLLGEHGASAN